MKAPAFWWRPAGATALLLTPAATIYGSVAALRLGRGRHRASVPVICVGNVTVGGSGKTPTAIALAALLRSAGRRPVFLTRGYGGRLAGPVAVDPGRHGSDEVGDEALMLVRHAPTIVSRDRVAGAALALEHEAELIVMDDGLQNPSLRKDLAIAVFDGAVGTGNGLPLPAGPLRAPLAAQWRLIDAALVVGPGEPGERIAAMASARGLAVLRATLVPDEAAIDRLAGRQLFAFAGIGRPEKFFDTCRDAGLSVAGTRAFPDHHSYGASELSGLLDEAERDALVPVTTEKDMVRLAAHAATEPRLALVQALPATLAFADPGAVLALLGQTLPGRGRPSRISTASGVA